MPFRGQPAVQNKILQKHWEERDLLSHHDRLASMKSRMDTRNPQYTQNKQSQNAKKVLTQEINLRRIQRDNDTLVKRINGIMSKDGVLTHNTAHRASATLNEPHRRREALHIIQENQKILSRITETKGMMSRDNWVKHAQEHEEVLTRLRGGTIRPMPNITLAEHPSLLPPITQQGTQSGTSARGSRDRSHSRTRSGNQSARSRSPKKLPQPQKHVWYRCEKEIDGKHVRVVLAEQDAENLKLQAETDADDEVAEIFIPLALVSGIWSGEEANQSKQTQEFEEFVLQHKSYIGYLLVESLHIKEGALIFVKPSSSLQDVMYGCDEWEEKNLPVKSTRSSSSNSNSNAKNTPHKPSPRKNVVASPQKKSTKETKAPEGLHLDLTVTMDSTSESLIVIVWGKDMESGVYSNLGHSAISSTGACIPVTLQATEAMRATLKFSVYVLADLNRVEDDDLVGSTKTELQSLVTQPMQDLSFDSTKYGTVQVRVVYNKNK